MQVERLQGELLGLETSIAFTVEVYCSSSVCAGLYDEERTTPAVFQPVPYHYIEVSRQLLMFAKDCFGANFHRVRSR